MGPRGLPLRVGVEGCPWVADGPCPCCVLPGQEGDTRDQKDTSALTSGAHDLIYPEEEEAICFLRGPVFKHTCGA